MIGTDGRADGVAAWLRATGATTDPVVAEDVADVAALQVALAGADPPVRFLAGIPVTAPGGAVVGFLCLLDGRPRRFRPEEAKCLRDLATLAAEHFAAEARAAEAAREDELYRLLAENSTDTIVRGDLDGVRLYISPAVRTLLGYEPEAMIGRKAIDIVHPDDIEAFGRVMSDVRTGRIDTVRPEHTPEAMGRPPRKDDHGGEVYVYRRTGQPCLVCGAAIRTTELQARNLFWCPRCQRPFRSRAAS